MSFADCKIWVEATSYEWYCEECGDGEDGWESELGAEEAGILHWNANHQEE